MKIENLHIVFVSENTTKQVQQTCFLMGRLLLWRVLNLPLIVGAPTHTSIPLLIKLLLIWSDMESKEPCYCIVWLMIINHLPSPISNHWFVIQITNDIKGKPLSRATEDPSLPICWKGPKPFKSLHDVTSNFKPLVLSFTKSKNSLFQVPPEAYLIVTVRTF